VPKSSRENRRPWCLSSVILTIMSSILSTSMLSFSSSFKFFGIGSTAIQHRQHPFNKVRLAELPGGDIVRNYDLGGFPCDSPKRQFARI